MRAFKDRAILLCLLLAASPAPASDETSFSGEITAGYDSNPAQTHHGDGYAFAQYALDAKQRWGDFALSADGWYRDYAGARDVYRLNLSADWTRELEQAIALLDLFVAGAIYRDALVPADERDELALGIRYDRLLSARDDLELSAEIRRLAYRNASLPWAGRSGSGVGMNAGSARSRHPFQGAGATPTRRDDSLIRLGLDLRRHWSPSLSSALSLTGERCDSPVSTEAYQRKGVGVLIDFSATEHWRLELTLDWSALDYDRGPQHQARDDEQRALGLAIARTLDWTWRFGTELRCGLDWLDTRSTLQAYSFRQHVAYCGIVQSFE